MTNAGTTKVCPDDPQPKQAMPKVPLPNCSIAGNQLESLSSELRIRRFTPGGWLAVLRFYVGI